LVGLSGGGRQCSALSSAGDPATALSVQSVIFNQSPVVICFMPPAEISTDLLAHCRNAYLVPGIQMLRNVNVMTSGRMMFASRIVLL
jgi:hypothetical protein